MRPVAIRGAFLWTGRPVLRRSRPLVRNICVSASQSPAQYLPLFTAPTQCQQPGRQYPPHRPSIGRVARSFATSAAARGPHGGAGDGRAPSAGAGAGAGDTVPSAEEWEDGAAWRVGSTDVGDSHGSSDGADELGSVQRGHGHGDGAGAVRRRPEANSGTHSRPSQWRSESRGVSTQYVRSFFVAANIDVADLLERLPPHWLQKRGKNSAMLTLEAEDRQVPENDTRTVEEEDTHVAVFDRGAMVFLNCDFATYLEIFNLVKKANRSAVRPAYGEGTCWKAAGY